MCAIYFMQYAVKTQFNFSGDGARTRYIINTVVHADHTQTRLIRLARVHAGARTKGGCACGSYVVNDIVVIIIAVGSSTHHFALAASADHAAAAKRVFLRARSTVVDV